MGCFLRFCRCEIYTDPHGTQNIYCTLLKDPVSPGTAILLNSAFDFYPANREIGVPKKHLAFILSAAKNPS
jgi:hypothetical protein